MDARIKIGDLRIEDTDIIEQLVPLVYEAFQEHAPGWLPTVAEAKEEILASLEPKKISRVLVDAARHPLGWIGAIPHNSGRIWEIHPLMIAVSEQGKGYGQQLVRDLELLASARGVLTLEAGTSDQTKATTLSGVDLYKNPTQAIANIGNLKRHPYEFYVKIGFKVVGVIPDAEGPGKPGIILAKRVETAAFSA
jgi:aminoglycoside 6'-N-acetyltransferase I